MMSYFGLISEFVSLSKKKYRVKSVFLHLFFILSVFDAIGNSFLLNENAFKVCSTPMIRLKMNGLVNSLDETVIYYQPGATDGFDSEFDAYKILGPNPAPHISQENNSIFMVINGIEPVVQTFSVNILATTPVTGNFTISATDFEFLPKGTCVYLNDVVTGTVVNILTGPYAFNLSNTTTTSRFILSITHFKLPTLSILTQPTCQQYNGGKIKVAGSINAPWNYIWKDSTGTIVKTVLNSNSSDSLENLSNGTYNVEITSANNSCYFKDTTFLINQIILPNVYFVSPDTITASIGQNYAPLNQSSNCETYYWNFGDETGTSNDFEPHHNYSICGLYKTKLIGASSSGCIDSTEKFVYVINLATAIIVELNQHIRLTDMGNNQFKIKRGNYLLLNELFIDLVNMEGKRILNQHSFSNRNEDILLDLNNFTTGIYALSIGYKDKVIVCSKIVIN